MKKSTLPAAPPQLTPEAADWWNKIVAEWQLDDAALLTLEAALEAFDRMKAAQALVAEHGILTKDRFGQPKLNPAVLVERDSRSAMLSALKALNLDLEPLNPGPGRPPKR